MGKLNSSINPFISTKIKTGINNTVHFGGTYDYKGVFEIGGIQKHSIHECDGDHQNQVWLFIGLCV